MVSMASKWLDLERSLSGESPTDVNVATATVDTLTLQSGVLNTLLTTVDMLNLASKSDYVKVGMRRGFCLPSIATLSASGSHRFKIKYFKTLRDA